MMKLSTAPKLSKIPEETSSELLRTVRSCPKCGSVKSEPPVSQIPSVTTSEAVISQVPSLLEKIGGVLECPDVRTNSEGLLTIVEDSEGVPTLLKMVGGLLEASEASEASEVALTPTRGGFYTLSDDPTVPPNTSCSSWSDYATASEVSDAPESSTSMMCVCFNCWKAAGGKTCKDQTGSPTLVSPLATNHIADIIPQTPTDELVTGKVEDSDSESSDSEATVVVEDEESEESLLREKVCIQADIIAKMMRLVEVSARIQRFRRRDDEQA